MKKSKLYSILVLLLVSNIAMADGSATSTLVGKRLQLISGGTSRLYIYDLVIQGGGCQNTTAVLLFDGPEANPIATELYSMLLTAKASGKEVTIQTTGCWTEWSTPIITSMYLHD